MLLAYGYAVNAPRWDFGKLLGIYVVFFFRRRSGNSLAGLWQKPSLPVLVGGAFIIIGGSIISLWHP